MSDPSNSSFADELAALDADFAGLDQKTITDKLAVMDAQAGPLVSTYSMWKMFKNCRRKCELRYLRCLAAKEKAEALSFGTVWHKCLELWHGGHGKVAIVAFLIQAYPNRANDEKEKASWHLATAMIEGYTRKYPTEEFKVIALEKKFSGKIINPMTGSASRSFTLEGRVDGVIEKDGQFFVMENKSASFIDSGYIEKLWTDFQIILYSHYIEQDMGIPIAGILYNVAVKTKMKQRQGETEEEYQVRYAEACKKNKNGKSSAKREMPETDLEFQLRLAERYNQPDAFYREYIYLSKDRVEALLHELWELTQSFLEAKRRGRFYENGDQCFTYHRPCEYFPACRSGMSPNVVDNLYEIRPPHEELGGETSAALNDSDSAF